MEAREEDFSKLDKHMAAIVAAGKLLDLILESDFQEEDYHLIMIPLVAEVYLGIKDGDTRRAFKKNLIEYIEFREDFRINKGENRDG